MAKKEIKTQKSKHTNITTYVCLSFFHSLEYYLLMFPTWSSFPGVWKLSATIWAPHSQSGTGLKFDESVLRACAKREMRDGGGRRRKTLSAPRSLRLLLLRSISTSVGTLSFKSLSEEEERKLRLDPFKDLPHPPLL